MNAVRRFAPLNGIRVLDFTWNLAGPYCSLQLALLGAEVIKVETATNLDGMRRGQYAIDLDPDASPTFNSVNLNKLGLRLNLKQAGGVETIESLAAVSDVLVENFRTGVLDRMGIGYEALRRHNPTIIVASSSAFGGSGPESSYPGYASVFNASGGLGSLTGYEDGPPVELRDSIDLRVGAALTYAVLCALWHRERTGEGQYIDLSSVEAIAALAGASVFEHLMTGVVPTRVGNRDARRAPHGLYRCRGDDWIAISVGSDTEFRALCGVMGRPGVARAPRFADGYRRLRHAAELDGVVEAWTRRWAVVPLTESLQRAGVAAYPAASGEMLLNDAHLRARGAWREVEHPRMGRRTVQGLAWQSSPDGTPDQRPAPLLGEHNDYILGGVLGLPGDAIGALAEAGAFE